MQDLNYIISLGFSGADIPRALILAFFLAMVFTQKKSIWTLGLVALLIDRVAWPVVEQATSAAGIGVVFSSLVAMINSFVDDLGVYVVRYLGLVIMIGLFREARVRLHHMAPAKKVHA